MASVLSVALRRSASRRGAGAALLCLAAVTACGGEPDPSPDADPTGGSDPPVAVSDTDVEVPETTRGAPAPVDSTDWTIGLLSAPATATAPPLPVLTAMRAGTHAEYERFTLELEASDGLPGYRVEYVDRPLHECGSGNQVFPVGDAWLELRLEPAAAHTEAGAPTLGGRDVAIGQPLLQRVYRTCDFEGVVVHVLALSTPNAFRVLTLSDPWRIAVDIER